MQNSHIRSISLVIFSLSCLFTQSILAIPFQQWLFSLCLATLTPVLSINGDWHRHSDRIVFSSKDTVTPSGIELPSYNGFSIYGLVHIQTATTESFRNKPLSIRERLTFTKTITQPQREKIKNMVAAARLPSALIATPIGALEARRLAPNLYQIQLPNIRQQDFEKWAKNTIRSGILLDGAFRVKGGIAGVAARVPLYVSSDDSASERRQLITDSLDPLCEWLDPNGTKPHGDLAWISPIFVLASDPISVGNMQEKEKVDFLSSNEFVELQSLQTQRLASCECAPCSIAQPLLTDSTAVAANNCLACSLFPYPFC